MIRQRKSIGRKVSGFGLILTAVLAFSAIAAGSAQAIWYANGAKFGKTAIVVNAGTFKFQIPDLKKEWTCEQYTKSASISNYFKAEMEIDFRNCSDVGSPHCVNVEFTPIKLSGTISAMKPTENLMGLNETESGGFCSWAGETTFALPQVFTAELGSEEVVSLPANVSGTGLYGTHTMNYSGSGSWELSGEYVKQKWTNKVPAYSWVQNVGSKGTGNGQFVSPQGVAIDSSSNVWVGDTGNDRIQKFNSSGTWSLKTGAFGSGNGQFNEPGDVATDSSGNVWVVDRNNHRLQKFNSSGTYQSQFGSKGSGNGQFNVPAGLGLDGKGDVWVADYNNSRVQEFSAVGTYLTKFGTEGSESGQLLGPTDAAVDALGNVWVADSENNRIQKFTSGGKLLLQCGSEGSENGQFNSPRGIAIDPEGYVWVSDRGNRRVEAFNSKCEYQTKFGASGTGNGQFGKELGYLAFDPANGNLWIADTGNNRIQKWVY